MRNIRCVLMYLCSQKSLLGFVSPRSSLAFPHGHVSSANHIQRKGYLNRQLLSYHKSRGRKLLTAACRLCYRPQAIGTAARKHPTALHIHSWTPCVSSHTFVLIYPLGWNIQGCRVLQHRIVLRTSSIILTPDRTCSYLLLVGAKAIKSQCAFPDMHSNTTRPSLSS